MEKEAIDTLATVIVAVSCSYIGLVVLIIVASNWNNIINGILKFLTHWEDIEDIRWSLAVFRKDEEENNKYKKTIQMPYRKFYKLWQSEKLNMKFDKLSVETTYTIEDKNDSDIVWITIYFSLFDTLFRYIPLKRSIDYYKNGTKRNKRNRKIRRLENRKEAMKEIDEFIKREE